MFRALERWMKNREAKHLDELYREYRDSPVDSLRKELIILETKLYAQTSDKSPNIMFTGTLTILVSLVPIYFIMATVLLQLTSSLAADFLTIQKDIPSRADAVIELAQLAANFINKQNQLLAWIMYTLIGLITFVSLVNRYFTEKWAKLKIRILVIKDLLNTVDTQEIRSDQSLPRPESSESANTLECVNIIIDGPPQP